ncbi:MAG: hypothetical protein JWP66_404 [Naasia sp.]|nr:hypothetical protein [Naasia sp.]
MWVAIAIVVVSVNGASALAGWIFATVFDQIAQTPVDRS